MRNLALNTISNCFLLCVILFSCRKKDNYAEILLYGHAGNGLNIANSIYHDNSKNAIEMALSQNGCDGVEVDVQLSKDGTLWLFHDQSLSPETNSSSCVNSLSDQELNELAYVHFNDEKLLKLCDLNLKGKAIILDLRHYNLCKNSIVDFNAYLQELKLFQDKNSTSKISLITNYLPWIDLLEDENFELIYAPNSSNDISEILQFHSFSAVIFKNAEISIKTMSELKKNNLKIYIFEVRSPKGIRSALKKMPNAVITDDLKSTIIEKY